MSAQDDDTATPKSKVKVIAGVTALMTLATAVVGLATVLSDRSDDSQPSPPTSTSSPPSPPPPVIEEPWNQQANEICLEALADIQGLSQPETIDEVVAYYTGILQTLRSMIERLYSLNAGDNQVAAREMLSSWEDAIFATDDAVAALTSGDRAAGESLIAMAEQSFAHGNGIARTLGARRCSFGFA